MISAKRNHQPAANLKMRILPVMVVKIERCVDDHEEQDISNNDDEDGIDEKLYHLTQSARGATSEPCCMKAPNVNQNAFKNVYWFSYLAPNMRLVRR